MANSTSARFLDTPPASAPQRVRQVHFGAGVQVALSIAVSNLDGVKVYSFAYDGVPVPLSGGKGSFYAIEGQKKLLEWIMSGEGGGTMKVVVTNGAAVIAQRDKSTITLPGPNGYDAFEILVS